MDYLPKDGLLFIDESHVMIPQISAMYNSDKSRKDNLIDYDQIEELAKEHNPKRFTEGYTSIRTLTDFNKHDVVIFNGHYETMLKRGWWHEYTMNPKPWWNDIDK